MSAALYEPATFVASHDIKRGDIITVTRDDESKRWWVIDVKHNDDGYSVTYDLTPAVDE